MEEDTCMTPYKYGAPTSAPRRTTDRCQERGSSCHADVAVRRGNSLRNIQLRHSYAFPDREDERASETGSSGLFSGTKFELWTLLYLSVASLTPNNHPAAGVESKPSPSIVLQ